MRELRRHLVIYFSVLKTGIMTLIIGLIIFLFILDAPCVLSLDGYIFVIGDQVINGRCQRPFVFEGDEAHKF